MIPISAASEADSRADTDVVFSSKQGLPERRVRFFWMSCVSLTGWGMVNGLPHKSVPSRALR
jgi:hypothetical protein